MRLTNASQLSTLLTLSHTEINRTIADKPSAILKLFKELWRQFETYFLKNSFKLLLEGGSFLIELVDLLLELGILLQHFPMLLKQNRVLSLLSSDMLFSLSFLHFARYYYMLC